MKTLRKFSKTIATTLIIIFSSYFFTGCYTLESTTKISTEQIPGTEEKTGKKKYTYETTQNPTIDNTEVNLKIHEHEQYNAQSKIKYKKEYYKNKGSDIWGFFGFLFGTLPVTTGIIGIVEEDYPLGIAILCSGISLMVLSGNGLFGKYHKSKYYYEPSDYEYYYKDLPLHNSSISITSSNKSIMFQTDNNALLGFDVVNDFNITNLPNNNSVIFNLKTNNTNFDKSLKLKPSLWMYKYAKIDVPECNIKLNKKLTSHILGIARKGMEYKILTEQDNNFKIELPNKTGWINSFCAESFYHIPKKSDINAVIRIYVEERVNKWVQRGEFEPRYKYEYRITYELEKKKQKYYNEAFALYQKDYISLIDWEKATLSRYDPDNYTFQVHIPGIDTTIITVPINIAKNFKNNWAKAQFVNQQFVPFAGQWKLKSMDIHIPTMNHTAKYNSEILTNYNPETEITITIDWPEDEQPVTFEQLPPEPEVTRKSDLHPGYNIRTNLPKTKMTNPDAIAVVIGNANYKHTKSVNFAINDALQMRTYLINVLGFSPGNIFFETDASIGTFYRIFGRKGKPNGSLHDRIKEGVSDVFVFYSGHGAPDEDANPYFLPADVDPKRIELTGYPLSVLYENLAALNAKSVTVIIDACFSGGGIIENVSAVMIKPKSPVLQIKNCVIITSSSNDEFATWYYAKQHGLFTWFFLKAIHDFKNSDTGKNGKLTFQEIYDYIADKTKGIPYYSGYLYSDAYRHHPSIIGNATERVFVEY